ncbi:ATP-binding cassette domain-containing protein [Streptacidiphilus rugosus]|uniref:ATP-binding cassette domain-containing protein n=1 Tax=Streptacidiphilus rugosus TaxID=405783 RepID=UPI00068AF7D5|nr:ATP-binding cassette domain-containing protein [Streptacidiphilus rugosus]
MASAPRQQPVLLRLRGVSKRHGLVQTLHEVDLELSRGEVVTLLGPPGAGKTTLCRAINGAERIDSGVILLDGAPLPARGRARRAARADVGLVPDSDAPARVTRRTDGLHEPYGPVWPGHPEDPEGPEAPEGPRRWGRRTGATFGSSASYVSLGPRGRGAPTGRTVLEELTRSQVRARGIAPEDAEQRALEQLHRVGAAAEAGLRRAQLSPSGLARVALARALVLDPKLLLVDEPPQELRELTHELTGQLVAEGLAMLVVSEEPCFAHAAADRVLFMSGGRIVESAPPQQFFTAPRTSRARDFVTRLLRR